MFKKGQILKIILLSSLLIGCASVNYSENQQLIDENDPLEPVNRSVFAFNDTMDTYVLRPIVKGYRAVTPEFVRNSVSNFFNTLSQPAHFLNALLQGQFNDAGSILGRTGVNLTFGFFGLFDVASEAGIPNPENDFGQTLAKWGWHDGGPFLMLPFLGPSNVRDTIGMGVDGMADPVYWRLHHTDEKALIYGGYALNAVQKRENVLDLTDNLKSSSTDYYAAMRTMYQQNRKKKVNKVLPESTEESKSYEFDFEIEDEE